MVSLDKQISILHSILHSILPSYPNTRPQSRSIVTSIQTFTQPKEPSLPTPSQIPQCLMATRRRFPHCFRTYVSFALILVLDTPLLSPRSCFPPGRLGFFFHPSQYPCTPFPFPSFPVLSFPSVDFSPPHIRPIANPHTFTQLVNTLLFSQLAVSLRIRCRSYIPNNGNGRHWRGSP
ncbi:hypothetical protein M430DRAFT_195262 [Amorphotheca resinae ATCC 22711]|uniref:Uncharacterized protein n=1 Tax=Amorphotheca resinae ATCC 22711 TaxID=857342 RepID=A0A2T3AP71_AMORE|nr:hypothetical protein M430DRAFT_195262 [Amorphotheca resinae ATCC 22711]PSS06724.1 hypothetical protein M430DRAFT_195262 [Amorphotheca resinae ATCC 22711]